MIDQILKDTSDKIEVDIYYNNVLTPPDSISIREIRDPNGNIILTNQSVTAGSTTGRYEYTMGAAYTSTLGVYTAIWRFVINSATYEHTQYFEVVSSLRQGYITPYEVRQKTVYEGITDDSPTDAVLQKYIDRSTAIMDNFFGGSINYAIYTEKRRCVLDKVHNGVHIQLKYRPIVSLTSVQLMQGPTNTLDLDTDYIRINEEAGYLEYFNDISVPTLRICTFDPSRTQIIPVATVVYTAGYVTVPDNVKEAAAMLVEFLYKQTKGDDKQLVRFTIDEVTEQYRTSKTEESAMAELGVGSVQPILKLLRPYRLPYKTLPFVGPLG
jgi:hypothetical protein